MTERSSRRRVGQSTLPSYARNPQSFSIDRKLTLPFILLGLLFAVVVIGGFLILERVERNADALIQSAVEDSMTLAETEILSAEVFAKTREYLLSGRGDAFNALRQATQALTQQAEAYRHQAGGEEGGSLLKRHYGEPLRSAVITLGNRVNQLIALKTQGITGVRLEEAENNLALSEEELGRLFADAHEMLEEEVQRNTADLNAALRIPFISLIVFPIVAVLLLAFGAGWLSQSLVYPLQYLTAAAARIAEGDLSTPAPISGQDEIGLLGGYFNRVSSQLQELQERLAESAERGTRRNEYLQATSALAQEASSLLEGEDLLQRVAELVSEQLGFYHVGIFLLDGTRQWAVLQAASSLGGQRMLERGHRLRVGEMGIVGYVVSEGRARVASEVGADAIYFDNPDLPGTRSEVALPLRARGELIGALDVQSEEPAAFSDEDVIVLQTLADLVAVAISNARLFEQVQASLDAERRAYGALASEAWHELLGRQGRMGYQYRQQGVLAVQDADPLPAAASETVISSAFEAETPEDAELPELVLPLAVRGNVIGRLVAHKGAPRGTWTQTERAFVENVVEQLEVALESARLFEETRRRAIREQLVGEISGRLRASLDVNTVLQTTLQELGRVLHAEGTVRLSPSTVTGAPEEKSEV